MVTYRPLAAVSLAALLPFACRPSAPVRDAEGMTADLACVVAVAEGATPAEYEACRAAAALVKAQPTASASGSAAP